MGQGSAFIDSGWQNLAPNLAQFRPGSGHTWLSSAVLGQIRSNLDQMLPTSATSWATSARSSAAGATARQLMDKNSSTVGQRRGSLGKLGVTFPDAWRAILPQLSWSLNGSVMIGLDRAGNLKSSHPRQRRARRKRKAVTRQWPARKNIFQTPPLGKHLRWSRLVRGPRLPTLRPYL